MVAGLDPIGFELLLALLTKASTEAELLERLPNISQATVNRRLDRLRDAGVVSQEPGRRRAPGRPWTVQHPSETEAVLDALLTLAEAIDARERMERTQARRRLKRARAARLGICEAGGQEFA